MNSTERIRAILANQEVDRPAVSGWVHLPLVDRHVDDFVRATISFTDYNRFDFIKVMTNGHYAAEAYGAEIKYSKDTTRWAGEFLRYPVRNAADAAALPVLDRDNPVFVREKEIVRRLKEHYQGTLPIIGTLFTPLMWFQEIFSCAQQQPTIRFMREHGQELEHALRAITDTSIHYLSQLVEGGVDGIFFATQYARNIITNEEFNRFCRPYELEILDYLRGKTWFDMLHVHGDANLDFNRILDYPVHALNWETSTASVPEEQLTSFRALRQQTDKVFIGGIDQTTDFYVEEYDRAKLKGNMEKRLAQAIAENGGNRFVFAPGCTLPMDVNHYAFTLIQEVAEESSRHRASAF